MGYMLGSKCKWCRANKVRFGSPYCSKKCETEAEESKRKSKSTREESFSSFEGTSDKVREPISKEKLILTGKVFLGVLVLGIVIEIVNQIRSALFYWDYVYVGPKIITYVDKDFNTKGREVEFQESKYELIQIKFKNKDIEKEVSLKLPIVKLVTEEIKQKGIVDRVVGYKLAPKYQGDSFLKASDAYVPGTPESRNFVFKNIQAHILKNKSDFIGYEISDFEY